MNEKFTPGPWKVRDGINVFTRNGARRRDGVEAAINDAWQVSDTGSGLTRDTDGQKRTLNSVEMVANAHLIAAAPDLYAALKCLYDMLHVASADHRIWTVGMQQAAKDALAKARGEARGALALTK